MLFNDPIFIFAFLPIALFGFYMLGRRGRVPAQLWLIGASLFYYGWWNPKYVVLLVGTTVLNYGLLRLIQDNQGQPKGMRVLTGAVALNLIALGYFKYANFFVNSVNSAIGTNWTLDRVILPLAISFYTFQLVGILVDAYRGKAERVSLMDFALFKWFFPQLIAGPIVHHNEIIPQFHRDRYLFDAKLFWAGLGAFVFGLFQKVIVADQMATVATPIFEAVHGGFHPGPVQSWVGALAYTLQLFHDFCGYSTMAIGLSLMFGMRLPANFNSPYNALSIVDFWKRWHITLSRFLQNYLYISLGGNRKGPVRRYVNLLLTMLIGGLWHGANWTFVAWGGLHGAYLCVCHGWRGLLKSNPGMEKVFSQKFWRPASWLLTFVGVVVAWVFFRAPDFRTAFEILRGMFLLNGASFAFGKLLLLPIFWIFFTLALTLYLPNIQEMMAKYQLVLEHVKYEGRYKWRPTLGWGLLFGVLLFFILQTFLVAPPTEFLYYNF